MPAHTWTAWVWEYPNEWSARTIFICLRGVSRSWRQHDQTDCKICDVWALVYHMHLESLFKQQKQNLSMAPQRSEGLGNSTPIRTMLECKSTNMQFPCFCMSNRWRTSTVHKKKIYICKSPNWCVTAYLLTSCPTRKDFLFDNRKLIKGN